MLTRKEETYLQKKLGRRPNLLEIDMIDAEWSEHCSYKSSKKYIRSLPSHGKRVVVGPGYDAGVLEIGDDDVITVHIESHNHPSAVEPYGGAATGVGGVIRGIISMGTRPIALLDALRFSSLNDENKTSKSKLLFKATIEASKSNCINAIKDLGGGGLSCCLSEMSHLVEKGFEVDLAAVHTKVADMSPNEIMISESQERMVYIINRKKLSRFKEIFNKYGITYSIIGKVHGQDNLNIHFQGKSIANISCDLMVNAPLCYRKSKKPGYLNRTKKGIEMYKVKDYNSILLDLLSNPNIGNKDWVFQQYDHEVGLRTVIKPGANASVIRVNDNKFVSIKLDGNCKHCYLDPYFGTLGCLSEASRNVVCTGAEPIGIIDHLQFGSPENPQIYWTFRKSVEAIIDFCNYMKVPVVGGKVSFYNETMSSPIKPSPVIGTIGLIKDSSHITKCVPTFGDTLFILGKTYEELGGTEYTDSIGYSEYGNVPKVDLEIDRKNNSAVLALIQHGLIDFAHDCSKGGIGAALAELAISGNVGIDIDLEKIPNNCSRPDYLLFSESHSRFIIGSKQRNRVKEILRSKRCIFSEIGEVETTKSLNLHHSRKEIINLPVNDLACNYNTINHIMDGT